MALLKTRWRRTRLCSAQRSSAPAGGTASRAGRAARLCGPPARGSRRSALLALDPAPARRPHQSRHSPRRCSLVRDLAARHLLARRPFSIISRMQTCETVSSDLAGRPFLFALWHIRAEKLGMLTFMNPPQPMDQRHVPTAVLSGQPSCAPSHTCRLSPHIDGRAAAGARLHAPSRLQPRVAAQPAAHGALD